MSGIQERIVLLENGAATGAAKIVHVGGRYVFSAVGTFNGATIQLQLLGGDSSTFISVTNGSVTAAGALAVDLPAGQVRALVTGGPPSGMYVMLARAPQG